MKATEVRAMSVDNPLKIAETKRDIARIKTVIREKEEN